MTETELLPNKVFIEYSQVELECVPVQDGVLQSLLAEIVSLEGMDTSDPESMMRLMGEAQALAISASEKLFNYCIGWGVKNDPPSKISEVSQLMGIRRDQPNLMRAAWVRYDLGATQQELSEIVGTVMSLTFVDQGTSVLEKQPDPEGQKD